MGVVIVIFFTDPNAKYGGDDDDEVSGTSKKRGDVHIGVICSTVYCFGSSHRVLSLNY